MSFKRRIELCMIHDMNNTESMKKHKEKNNSNESIIFVEPTPNINGIIGPSSKFNV